MIELMETIENTITFTTKKFKYDNLSDYLEHKSKMSVRYSLVKFISVSVNEMYAIYEEKKPAEKTHTHSITSEIINVNPYRRECVTKKLQKQLELIK